MLVLETRPNGSPKMVEMTDEEVAASDYMETLLDMGYSTVVAVGKVRVAYPHLSQPFFDWIGY